MSYQESINKIKPELDRAVEYFKVEISKIRTGRASPAIVENIEVESYGTKLTISQLAAISTPDPRQIVIQPWDKNSIEAIQGALSKANLGMNPVVDGQLIRLIVPPLTEERRKDYIKILGQKLEEAKVSVRRQRENAWTEIQDLAREGKIREDDKFRGKDELQKVIDEYQKKIEEIGNKKEVEIMTV